tara:strand:+ start:1064 stop:1324 length:261 start_codon:yes stop_codon:yes gene_type:complete
MTEKKINILLSIEEYSVICGLLSSEITNIENKYTDSYTINNYTTHQDKMDFHIKLTNKFRKKIGLNKLSRFLIPKSWWDDDDFQPN